MRDPTPFPIKVRDYLAQLWFIMMRFSGRSSSPNNWYQHQPPSEHIISWPLFWTSLQLKSMLSIDVLRLEIYQNRKAILRQRKEAFPHLKDTLAVADLLFIWIIHQSTTYSGMGERVALDTASARTYIDVSTGTFWGIIHTSSCFSWAKPSKWHNKSPCSWDKSLWSTPSCGFSRWKCSIRPELTS